MHGCRDGDLVARMGYTGQGYREQYWVDYHIGIVTSDPAENGVLRPYVGPAVTGCSNCRFITTDVPCENPDVDISGLSSESEIENKLLDECQVDGGGGAFARELLDSLLCLVPHEPGRLTHDSLRRGFRPVVDRDQRVLPVVAGNEPRLTPCAARLRARRGTPRARIPRRIGSCSRRCRGSAR